MYCLQYLFKFSGIVLQTTITVKNAMEQKPTENMFFLKLTAIAIKMTIKNGT